MACACMPTLGRALGRPQAILTLSPLRKGLPRRAPSLGTH